MSEDLAAGSQGLTPTGKRQKSGKSSNPARAKDTFGPDVIPTEGNFFAKIPAYLRGVVAEIQKVIWPTWRQMGIYTAVVLVFLIVLIALVAGVDWLAGQGVRWSLTQ